ncbi:histidine phosphatase family protein [Actinoplanes awajinensis]|uniref:Phosphoglycerate mutase n=1 Tax=Actinoplanes awajinensis subsp. mycoplanecinus TaxID=135947 RepID=A0A0X3UZW7_9ACTN|nr:histidine phosphatase family protein [Actinoplanes awajinensis]KUL38024.1 phosphoglycerate mutase [Actinoplanes awajinensis subsp. mycoplanecinus]
MRPEHEAPRESLSWLAVVRHGQSTGNVAAEAAETAGAEVIEILERDADVPLSGTGREQATALSTYFADLPAGDLPAVAVVSPYLRARQTAQIALGDLPVAVRVDERLRDRELGIFDLLTARGVKARLPDEARRRARLGKFYHRPPGGESWADVLLRLRSLLRELRADHPDGRVVLFAHDALVMLTRYLVEDLDEATLMAIAREVTIANCSVSSWRRAGGRLVPESFNDVRHLLAEAAPVTEQEAVDAGRA